MGGFKNLKIDFEGVINQPGPDGDPEEAFRYLMLRCLFEIAGNLDTIAVEMRKQTTSMVSSDSHGTKK